MSREFDVVCLGGGVAGEAIAFGLQDSGLTLAVVERELVGGECPYWGCVPSKTLLRSAETLEESARARVLAASRVEWNVDFPKVSRRVLWMARNLDDTRPAAAMEATGARLFRGEGKLNDLRTVEVGGEQLVARRAIVIANGSTAAIPPISGLDKVEFWTNRQAAIPRELPVSLAILGGGAIGVELAWLKVDPATLEAQPGVFGAGDVTGLGGFTHLADYHGQIVARRLRGLDARADHTAVPRVTFTDPEIASVGLSEAAARAKGIDVVVASTARLHPPRAGEILGELVLAIKLGTPLKTLADIIHPYPAFNRVLGTSLGELAEKAASRR
ncbi:MAG TPA: FAD-dependent oxidoreductase [Vicinamibacterales bacterium]|nr:FAD-dependent oxidoreductase [Vicinamibacterales bacterium]